MLLNPIKCHGNKLFMITNVFNLSNAHVGDIKIKSGDNKKELKLQGVY